MSASRPRGEWPQDAGVAREGSGVVELIALTVPVRGLADEAGGDGDGTVGEPDFVLRHSETALVRGLDHGEEVLLVGVDGEYHTAVVVDLDFEREDTLYGLRLGSRIPPEQVRDRMLHVPPAVDEDAAPGPEDEQSVVDLLGELRRRWQDRDG
ncbi:hypothetical protein [Nocardioides sp. GY 10127]|uniref:hypothetical protein n=1 Tax=Nocardioides sp. GY 10127 TaxID=2569762 RepID=UPI0010A895BE|nr:hypothetical protein [Nocardioides sp. GY 10127]TIC79009.1 hypothetical protein E8D37_18490 [Nocardioides sp. GY 10127]